MELGPGPGPGGGASCSFKYHLNFIRQAPGLERLVERGSGSARLHIALVFAKISFLFTRKLARGETTGQILLYEPSLPPHCALIKKGAAHWL